MVNGHLNLAALISKIGSTRLLNNERESSNAAEIKEFRLLEF